MGEGPVRDFSLGMSRKAILRRGLSKGRIWQTEGTANAKKLSLVTKAQ